MKYGLFICCLGLTLSLRSQIAVLPLPTPTQTDWQNHPFYLFMHFGPNTFTDLEWGKGSEQEALFNPKAMDCHQWCRIAKAAGATGIIITAKHHDGFCLWPSEYSKHTVAQSTWKNGQGDVLKELSEACREEGLSMGVYLSPWDRNHPAYGTSAYNTVFIQMMKEVVRRYGPFFEFWWDGANGEGPNGKKQVYDWKGFELTLRQIAPHTLVFSDIGPDIRWAGNEKGTAGLSNWNLLDTAGFSRGLGAPPNDTLNQGNVNGQNWIPAECDVSIRPGWFYHPGEDSLVKTPEELFHIYMKSVGRGANLIVNVPPNRLGLISAVDSAALLGFARLRRESFDRNLVTDQKAEIFYAGQNLTGFWAVGPKAFELGSKYKQENLEIRFQRPLPVNCVMLQESLGRGQRVESWLLALYRGDSLVFQTRLTTIGQRRMVSFPKQFTDRILIKIIDAKAEPILNGLGVYDIRDDLIVSETP